MKNLFTTFLIFCISHTCIAQQGYYIVSGKVIDKNSHLPLQAASVFAQNTTIGTATDAEGNFKLWLPNGGYDLIVTFTGYETENQRISSSDSAKSNLVISIGPKEKMLEAVAVVGTNEVKDGWEKYGSFFLDNFIGKTSFSRGCTITNPDILKFFFSKKRNRLKILASAPLEVKNDSLGYKIKYSLDSFTYEYNTQVCLYTGFPLFEEITPSSEEQKTTWHTNRLKAYNGSMLHFMKSVYSKRLKEEGFEIQFVVKNGETDTAIQIKDIYGGLKFNKDDSAQSVEIMPNQRDVAVLYNKEEPDQDYLAAHTDLSKKFQLSIITIAPQQSLVIEQNGYYYDQNDITITGYWDWEKVGNMLPYDFNPN